jgi:hypothetical protein
MIWPDDVLSCFPFIFFFFCSLSPLILFSILFYFFFLVPPLSIFFLCFFTVFFSSIFSLFLRLCISFAGEVNSARWINLCGTIHLNSAKWINLLHYSSASWISLGTVHLNSVSTVHETASDPVRKKLFFFNCILFEKLVFNIIQ